MADKLFSDLAKGAYNGATAYTVGDFVTYNGSSYACIQNSTGNLPTDTSYWALLASKGDTGSTGATGDTGAAGSNGTNGTDGDDAFVYIAYASDASGTDFTLTFNAALDYIAIKTTTTAIASPAVGDFVGLWKNYKGATGATGATGPSGGVDSVNGDTGVVVLTQDDVGDGTTYKQYSATEKTKLSGIETSADVTDAGNVGSSIDGATAKTTPVDADTMPLIDSAAANVLKKVTWANIKATLKAYFDTLYAATLGADDNYVTDAEKTKLANLSGTNTGDQTLPVKATSAEIDTGTDDAKFLTADGFAGASRGKRIVHIKVFDDATAATTGDGKAIFFVPVELNGMNLVDCEAYVTGASSSGALTIQIRNITQTADMLSTAITIDVSENSSLTAATAPVIDAANDDVATGDLIAIDVDGAGTSAEGLGVVLSFQTP